MMQGKGEDLHEQLLLFSYLQYAPLCFMLMAIMEETYARIVSNDCYRKQIRFHATYRFSGVVSSNLMGYFHTFCYDVTY